MGYTELWSPDPEGQTYKWFVTNSFAHNSDRLTAQHEKDHVVRPGVICCRGPRLKFWFMKYAFPAVAPTGLLAVVNVPFWIRL